MEFTVHVRFTLEPDAQHTVNVLGKDTVGKVVGKVAEVVKVDAEDITLYHEGVPLDDLTQDIDRTPVVEGSEVEARPSKRHEARRELTDMGLGWKSFDLLLDNAMTDEEKVRVVRLMLEAGADVGTLDADADTPLHIASCAGVLEVVKLLISSGADVAAVGKESRTPLHDAADCGHFEVAQLLVDAGADIEAVEWDKYTPLHRAALTDSVEVVRCFINAGADIEAVTRRTCTPLHLAASEGHFEVVQFLVDAEADITAVDRNKNTALHFALDAELEVVELLIKAGSDIEAVDGWDRTPLRSASAEGNLEVVKLLVGAGARLTEALLEMGSYPEVVAAYFKSVAERN